MHPRASCRLRCEAKLTEEVLSEYLMGTEVPCLWARFCTYKVMSAACPRTAACQPGDTLDKWDLGPDLAVLGWGFSFNKAAVGCCADDK